MKQSIVKWLFELNAKQREVLARRFGLLGYEAATLEDVGREIGLTRERVRQIGGRSASPAGNSAGTGAKYRSALPRIRRFLSKGPSKVGAFSLASRGGFPADGARQFSLPLAEKSPSTSERSDCYPPAFGFHDIALRRRRATR